MRATFSVLTWLEQPNPNFNVASQHERNYIPWNFFMQPAVRACVQSSKRPETANESRHCNITEFLQK
jgi:hypothetical protein